MRRWLGKRGGAQVEEDKPARHRVGFQERDSGAVGGGGSSSDQRNGWVWGIPKWDWEQSSQELLMDRVIWEERTNNSSGMVGDSHQPSWGRHRLVTGLCRLKHLIGTGKSETLTRHGSKTSSRLLGNS